MSSIEPLLGALCPEIEGQLKPYLSGFMGMVVRSYLPQAWTFRTEEEVVTLQVDTQGNARVVRGGSAPPDVTIEASSELLTKALTMRNPRALPPGERVNVVPHTPKGRTAFDFLRQRLGL